MAFRCFVVVGEEVVVRGRPRVEASNVRFRVFKEVAKLSGSGS